MFNLSSQTLADNYMVYILPNSEGGRKRGNLYWDYLVMNANVSLSRHSYMSSFLYLLIDHSSYAIRK